MIILNSEAKKELEKSILGRYATADEITKAVLSL